MKNTIFWHSHIYLHNCVIIFLNLYILKFVEVFVYLLMNKSPTLKNTQYAR